MVGHGPSPGKSFIDSFQISSRLAEPILTEAPALDLSFEASLSYWPGPGLSFLSGLYLPPIVATPLVVPKEEGTSA